MTNNEFKFRTSISREGYPNKETAKACLMFKAAKNIGRVKMAFKEQEVTVDEFINYAISGYSFCNLFKFNEDKQYWIGGGKYWNKTYPVYKRGLNKGYFKLSFKQNKFFNGSQTIFVDVDYTHFNDINDYIKALKYKPTCVYTSFSDKVMKSGIESRRFRLVYVFDRVLNEYEFRSVSINLYTQIIKDTKEPMLDCCGMGVSQYMNGSNSTEVYKSYIIYTPEDIEKVVEVETVKEKKVPNKIVFTRELVNDMENLPFRTVVEKWWVKGLRYISKTDKEFDGFYSTDTDDYYSLFWHNEKVTDGNKRRMKMFLRAALRRLMKPDITADELLYNLYIDRQRFFDNSDDVLNVEVLQGKVKGAMQTEISIIKGFADEYKKPSFIINKNVLNKRSAVGKARKDIKDKLIDSLYDTSMSVKDNLQSMKASGVKISQARLYKWVNENGVNEKKVVEYNPELSIRENMSLMGCTKYQVEKARKEYLANLPEVVEETPVVDVKVAENGNKDYSEAFAMIDNYFDSNFDGAAEYFRFYDTYESIDTMLKDNWISKFNVDNDTLYHYYLQYQPWVGAKNSYGIAS